MQCRIAKSLPYLKYLVILTNSYLYMAPISTFSSMATFELIYGLRLRHAIYQIDARYTLDMYKE